MKMKMKIENENDNKLWGRCVITFNIGDVRCNWAGGPGHSCNRGDFPLK